MHAVRGALEAAVRHNKDVSFQILTLQTMKRSRYFFNPGQHTKAITTGHLKISIFSLIDYI